MPKRLFLIDGTAVAYRAHFAFAMGARGGLTTKDGRATSAVFGFLTTLKSLLDREDPDAIAVSFDGPTKDLERTKRYPKYKATREEMPDDLFQQLGIIEDVVKAYHIPVVRSPGHEADDVIGTLAMQGKDAGMTVFMVTGDKDFMQLVSDDVKMWNLRSSTSAPEIIGPKEVEQKYGVRPDQMIDFLALMGDSSDNIPGVPKVGQKTAAELLQQFDTMEEALERTDEVKKPSIRKTLTENRDLALLSKDLVTIITDVPLDITVDDLKPAVVDRELLEPMFRDLEFDSMVASLPREEMPQIPQHYHVVRTDDELETLITGLREAGSFAFDTETTSLQSMDADLVGISVCWEPGTAYYVPFNLDPPLCGGRDQLLEALRPWIEDPELKKTLQNAKYDMGVLRRAGLTLRGVDFDTMLASYVVSPGEQGGHGLDTQALRHFSYKKIPTKELIGTGKKQKTFDQIDIDLVGRYAAEDADFTWRLREIHEDALSEHGLMPIFQDVEMPLIPVLLDMEWEGIRIDLEHLARLGTRLGERLATIESGIFELAGEPFNLNSPAQIGEILFGKLEVHKSTKIRPKKTKTGQWKTDAAMLEKLAEHHEVPRLILDYRQLSKLKSTYVDSLPKDVRPDTGRIHTSFNQAVAATGRLSSDEPNLQNIPIRTEEGREVRRAFIAREGWTLLSADYSQIELRILAHMSGDKALIEAFRRGEDIHTRTIALIHGIMPEMVTPELRSQAKVINYGLVYGMGASRLARETGMTPPEAKKFIAAYFAALPGVKRYLDATLEEAQRTGQVQTLFGRRRLLPEIDSTNVMQRIAAENMAVNTPIQGSAADIIKRAMLAVHARLAEEGLRTKLLLQVHDELVLDVPLEEVDAAKALLKECMEGAADLEVPLSVSMGTGTNWLEAH